MIKYSFIALQHRSSAKNRSVRENENKARTMKRAIHRQYGKKRHCHGVALFVDAVRNNDDILSTLSRPEERWKLSNVVEKLTSKI